MDCELLPDYYLLLTQRSCRQFHHGIRPAHRTINSPRSQGWNEPDGRVLCIQKQHIDGEADKSRVDSIAARDEKARGGRQLFTTHEADSLRPQRGCDFQIRQNHLTGLTVAQSSALSFQ